MVDYDCFSNPVYGETGSNGTIDLAQPGDSVSQAPERQRSVSLDKKSLQIRVKWLKWLSVVQLICAFVGVVFGVTCYSHHRVSLKQDDFLLKLRTCQLGYGAWSSVLCLVAAVLGIVSAFKYPKARCVFTAYFALAIICCGFSIALVVVSIGALDYASSRFIPSEDHPYHLEFDAESFDKHVESWENMTNIFYEDYMDVIFLPDRLPNENSTADERHPRFIPPPPPLPPPPFHPKFGPSNLLYMKKPEPSVIRENMRRITSAKDAELAYNALLFIAGLVQAVSYVASAGIICSLWMKYGGWCCTSGTGEPKVLYWGSNNETTNTVTPPQVVVLSTNARHTVVKQ